jgi:TolB-like protein
LDLAGWVFELKRRRVFRALVAWGVLSFAVLQVIEPVQHGLHWPDWTISAVVWVLGLGFPVTAAMAWVFDLGAGGVTRTPAATGTAFGGSRTALMLLALGTVAAAPGVVYYFIWPQVANRAAGHAGTPTTQAAAAEARGPAPSIAVLPFADMSAARDQEYMGDGLAEEILNLLAQVDGLQVTGRTSSFAFKGKGTRLEEIGRDLHVEHVLEGSVRRVGQRIRVTAQLVKTADGFHLWSQNFDRDLADALALQDEVARAVVGAIAPRLTGRAPAASRTGPAPSPEAYAAYLEGKQGLRGLDEGRLKQAQGSLERAVELAPDFAPAHVALARVYGQMAGYFVDTPEDVTRYSRLALASAERAVALAPDLGDAHAALARHALSYAFDFAAALSHAERAVALAPGSADARSIHAHALAAAGRDGEALAEARRAAEADPLAEGSWGTLGFVAMRLDKPAVADEALRYMTAHFPGSPLTLLLGAQVRLRDGRREEALVLFQRNPFEFLRQTGTAICEHLLGHEAASLRAVAVLEGKLAGSAAYQVAQARAMRGEPDQAFAWLERARLQHDSGLAYFPRDPFLVPLHADPRWKTFRAQFGLAP